MKLVGSLRRAAGTCGLLGTLCLLLPGLGQAVPLTNTPVTQSEVSALFAINGPGLVAINDGNIPGVHLNTRVWEGTAGTAAEGLFLYDYWLEDQGNAAAVRDFLVGFGPVVGLDFTGDVTPETSAHCSNCTTFPVPIAPDSSDQTGLVASFQFSAGADPFSRQLYFVSDAPPLTGMATLVLEGVGASQLLTLTPLPEPGPGPLLLLAAGLLAIRSSRFWRHS